MKAVTIDNIGIKNHERYAQDQLSLDLQFIAESKQVPQHSEIMGTSCIYSSQLDALFEINLCNPSWAAFAPPPDYFVQSNRFFSYRLSPYIYFARFEKKRAKREEGDEESDEEEQESGKDRLFEMIEKLLTVKEAKDNPRLALPTFEKEKTSIFNLIESIDHLNTLLEHIQARKAQYQKG